MTDITTYKKDPFYDPKCHYGNTKIYQEPDGGALYIGGWSKGAHFNQNTYVIDLTGTEHKYYDIPVSFDDKGNEFLKFFHVPYAGWISMPFPDMKVPTNITTLQQWTGVAQTVQKILKSGNDVLVACHGGHGRSGLFCSIVGYLLNINNDRSWSSPVEKVRGIHCIDAIETYAQEKYVYEILALDIEIKTVYAAAIGSTWKYEQCPICGTQTTFVHDIGMCLGCEKKYKNAPVKEFFTAADLKTKGEIDHACSNPNCIGIWTSSECKHTVHDMIIVDGFCAKCLDHIKTEDANLGKDEDLAPCAICEKPTWYGDKFGVCYECGTQLVTAGQIDFVHNTITDPYRAIPHSCDNVGCVGIVVADKCGHILHNQEVEDGNCAICQAGGL